MAWDGTEAGRAVNFAPIRYLRWARQHIGGEPPPFGLASSAASHLEPGDLGLDLDGLGLTTPSLGGVPELRGLLAGRYRVSADRLLLTAGCTLANFLLVAALVRPGDRVLVERPSYEPLWRIPQALGARTGWLRRRPEEGWEIPIPRLEAALKAGPIRLVVLSNLHNPSGRRTDPERVAECGRLARRHGARVLWDEIYLECQDQPGPPAAVIDPRASLSTLSLSKTYGLAGLKVGWALGPPALLRRARAVADYLSPYNPPLVERVALRALEQADRILSRSLEVSRRNRQIASAWADRRADLTWSQPDGGFLGLARLRDPQADSRRLEALLEEGGQTMVGPGHHFGDRRAFRLGLGCPDPARLRAGLTHLDAALERMGSSPPP